MAVIRRMVSEFQVNPDTEIVACLVPKWWSLSILNSLVS